MSNQIIEKLRDDNNYYGSYGKQFLSASSVRNLLFDPTNFGKHEKALPLLQGGYFHTLMLEPEKLDTYTIFGTKTRNNKEFNAFRKEHDLHQYDILLEHEKVMIESWADKLKSDLDVCSIIYEPTNEFEIPAITEIDKTKWKGKCDILRTEPFVVRLEDEFGDTSFMEYPNGAVIDLKTSGNIHKFKWSAKEYCYDAQAYIYKTLFNRPMLFIVIDKSSLQVKICPCSDDFYERGREKVEKAIRVYKKFFGHEATNNINNYLYSEIL